MKDKIYNEFPIETERLYINKIELDELIKIKSNVSKSEKFKITCRPIKERNDFELKEFYKGVLDSNSVIFAIKDKSNNELLGDISFSDYNERNNSIEMGYYLLPEFRSKGYMKEVILNVLDVLFNKVNLNKVYAQTGSFNKESINMLIKLGLKKDAVLRMHHEINGVFHDDYIFSMLRKEWNTKSRKISDKDIVKINNIK